MATARAITDNYGEVPKVLRQLEDSDVGHEAPIDLRMETVGLIRSYGNVRFVFLAFLMKEVLSLLEPGNAALQDKEMHLGKAAEVMTMCLSVLKRKSKSKHQL